MSFSANVKLPPLTIPNGGTTSNAVFAAQHFGDASGIMIYTPSGISDTIRIQVTNAVNETETPTWYDLQSGDTPADVATPAAGKAQVYDTLVLAGGFRLVASSAVTGDKTLYATKQYTF